MSTKTFLTILIALNCIIWSQFAKAEQGFSSLEERMTGQEFRAAGLERLSAEELASVNAWVRAHSLGLNESVAVNCSEFAANNHLVDNSDNVKYESDDTILSRIKGEFTGWSGTTVFELDNGMIWVQDEKDTLHIKLIENPEVIIRPNMFSVWKLSVVGYNKRVKVKRIQ